MSAPLAAVRGRGSRTELRDPRTAMALGYPTRYAVSASRRVLSPAWSSDAITTAGRAKLHGFGLAPPDLHGGALLPASEAPLACPRCGSLDTQLRSAFGSALCREIHICRSCREPFERFKPV